MTAQSIIADALRRKPAQRRGAPVELETLGTACRFGQTPTQLGPVHDCRQPKDATEVGLADLDIAEMKHIALMVLETGGTVHDAAKILGVPLLAARDCLHRKPVPLRPHCVAAMVGEVAS